MRNRIPSIAALALALAAASGAFSASLEVRSVPERARVYVDGRESGRTPAALDDIAPGRHRVRIELEDHEPYDAFVDVQEDSSNAMKPARLVREKGLLLITSEPSGAEVVCDGSHVGETPRLVANLDADRRRTHSLLLRKTGYRDASVEVVLSGRTPVVKNVPLVLDAGSLVVETKPSGAEITVNGASKGVSPVTLEEVAKGTVRVEARLAGYAPQEREVVVAAGKRQTVSFELSPVPGSLRLSSVPEGARFYVNGKPFAGAAKGVEEGLAPGEYEIRAELAGHAMVERTVTVRAGEETAEEFRLESVAGSLEFKTRPAGVTVFVDGKKCGKTAAVDSAAEWSDVLVVRNVIAGDHEIRMEMEGYQPRSFHLESKAREAVSRQVTLKKAFHANRRVKLYTGEVVEGELVREDGLTITLRTARGLERPIPQDNVQKYEVLFPDP